MLNSQDPKLPTTTSGKRKPESQEPSLSSESSQSDAMSQQTGTESGSTPSLEMYSPSQPIYEFNITGHSALLLRTLAHQLLWNDKFMSLRGELALENLDALGKKPVFLLILKIPVQNSGMDIEIKSMLSSTNFEEVSISPTYSAGSIGTLCLWRSKDLPPPW